MPKYEYDLPPHRVTYETAVRIDTLVIDEKAQRSLDEKRAEQIAYNLIPDALGALVVSERADGSRVVVDGQHRKFACELNGILKVACEIHHGLTLHDEAQLFLIKNKESRKPSKLDEYKIGLIAELPLYIDTQKILDKHDLKLGGHTSGSTTAAVAGIVRITEWWGADILDRVLWVAESAWSRDRYTWDGMLLSGLGDFLGKHGELADDVQLAAKLRRKSAQMWIQAVNQAATDGNVHGSGSGGRRAAMYRLVKKEWNKRRKLENQIP